MKTFRSEGHTLSLTAPYAVTSGNGFLVGAIFAIAACDAASGAAVEGKRVGEFTLPKATGAVTQGQKLYWDDTAKVVTTTASTNKLIGAATIAAQSADATVSLVLIPTAS